MVKRKSLPKPRLEAGFAARNEQPVNDTTIASDNEEDDETGTSSDEPATTSKAATFKKPTTITSRPTISRQGAASSASKHKSSQVFKKPPLRQGVFNEIKRLQSSTGHVIPKAPFLRVVKEITQQRGENYRFTEMAVEALREASESVLTGIFEDSYLVSLHAKRVTLFPRDMALALTLRRDPLSSAMLRR